MQKSDGRDTEVIARSYAESKHTDPPLRGSLGKVPWCFEPGPPGERAGLLGKRAPGPGMP